MVRMISYDVGIPKLKCTKRSMREAGTSQNSSITVNWKTRNISRRMDMDKCQSEWPCLELLGAKTLFKLAQTLIPNSEERLRVEDYALHLKYHREPIKVGHG